MDIVQWMMGMLMLVVLYFLYLLQRDRETCRWRWEKVDNFYGRSKSLWVTTCGHKVIGKATTDEYNWCPYCGRQIVEVEHD